MIVESLLGVVFGMINFLLLPLQIVDFALDVVELEPVIQFVNMALYLIPFNRLMPIFIFFISMMSFRIIISLIKTIWDLLPIA